MKGKLSNSLELDGFLWIICVAICKSTNNRIITKKNREESFGDFFLEPQYEELETNLMVKMNPFPSLGQSPTLRILVIPMSNCFR